MSYQSIDCPTDVRSIGFGLVRSAALVRFGSARLGST
ncbi:unnamed protein product, partial [Soboliphyme baturini]|uniref:Bestrophin homolog n=1 Tax=Soboliphyme baturini TaxID=241478 RepID=A0A183IRA8_9BILA